MGIFDLEIIESTLEVFFYGKKQNIVKKLNWRLLKIFNLYIRLINRIKIVLFFPFLFIFVEKWIIIYVYSFFRGNKYVGI